MNEVQNSPTMKESPGAKAERIAFAYCKIATFSFLCGRYVLPVAATLSAGLYLIAVLKGKHDTRCWLRYPPLIAAVWASVVTIWLAAEFGPEPIHQMVSWFHLRG